MENFAITYFLPSLCLSFLPAFTSCSQGGESHLENSDNGFIVDESWPDAEVNSKLLYGSGVAVDASGNVLVLHRGSSFSLKPNHTMQSISEDVLLVISPISGKVLKSWGRNKFVKPHGIGIDRENNLFITDIVLHQVFKFRFNRKIDNWENEPLLTLGEEFVSGDDPFHFCRPTDVATLYDGTIYVSDGYCNSRIVYFSKQGTYRGEFYAGHSKLDPLGFLPFNVTHAITIAEVVNRKYKQNSADSVVFVADRNNLRVQAFSTEGIFLFEIRFANIPENKNTNAMLLSVAFRPFGEGYSPDQTIGTLYAVVGHLPFGESRILEVVVGKNGFHFEFSIEYSKPFKTQSSKLSNGRYQDILRLETPHDLAITADGNTIFTIEAFKKLIVKKFVRKRSSKIKSLSPSVCCPVHLIIVCIFLIALSPK